LAEQKLTVLPTKVCERVAFRRAIGEGASVQELGRDQAAIEALSSPEGGFMIKAEIADPNIPLEVVEAICVAFEDFCVPT
jgi:hypothetical protein